MQEGYGFWPYPSFHKIPDPAKCYFLILHDIQMQKCQVQRMLRMSISASAVMSA